jgi:heme exporter protein A
LSGYEDLPCRTFSAGQRRRVALALLLLSDARLWLLDEPFTAIDSAGVAMIEQLMADHIGRGGAIVLTSHQPVRLAGLRTLELSAGQGDE